MAEWWPRTHNSGVMPLLRFSDFAILEDFSGTMKARKMKICMNIDDGWMYCVYWNRDEGSITRGVMSLGMFSKKKKCILLNNFLCLWPYFEETYIRLGL